MNQTLTVEYFRYRNTNKIWQTEHTQLSFFGGGFNGLLGDNGTGKKHLCSLICGLNDFQETTGSVIFEDSQAKDCISSIDRKKVGYVPSNPTLMFSGIKNSVYGELELAFQFIGKKPTLENKKRLQEVLQNFHLESHLSQDPFSLSGGEAARLACALAVIKKPSILVLENFYESLDPLSIPQIRNAIENTLCENSIVIETFSRDPFWMSFMTRKCQRSKTSNPWKYSFTEFGSSKLSALIETSVNTVNNKSTESDKAALLEVRALSYTYECGSFSLGPLDITLNKDEITALVGPNGSGKTTLFRCLANILLPISKQFGIHENSTTFKQPDEKNLHLWAREVLYNFQNPDDQIYLPTVERELAETARVFGALDDERFREIATHFGFNNNLSKSPFDLEPSERRLLIIAAALIAKPSVILLDEPTVSLDQNQVGLLESALEKYIPSEGAVCLISHDMVFIENVANRVIDIRDL